MSDNSQDEEVLRRIEMEVRLRDGAGRLLAACSRRGQALEASKSLISCNARILALLGRLQQTRREQVLQRVGRRSSEEIVPCLGKVCLSDLRIPLMWKDSEYFKNKGELQRCAVFCLLQCGAEIHDTDLVMVDRTLTDVCFEDTVVFGDVGPGFELRVELYSSSAVEEFCPPGAPGPPRRMSCLGGSLGSSSGKKIRAAFESAAVCGGNVGPGAETPPSSPGLFTQGPKFNLLASATLRLQHVQDGFKTHDLSLAATEDDPYWLPLYGNMCCRLVAQPLCMIQPVISGQLEVKLGEELVCRDGVFAVLRGQSLCCYQSHQDTETEDKLLFEIPVNKETLVCADAVHSRTVYVTTRRRGEDAVCSLTTNTADAAQRWAAALGQHVYDMSQWKQCCDRLMKMEVRSIRKSVPMKQGSLYHEIVTPSPPGERLAVLDLSEEIRTLLTSYYKESY